MLRKLILFLSFLFCGRFLRHTLQARDLVLRSSGVQRTRALAQEYADKAQEVLQDLPSSEAKIALEVLAERVIGRKS